MGEPVKGTVTSLSSIFPPEEAQKAAKRVEDTIADHQSELDRLREFIADNTNLVNLVQRLPDELHHDIMAPAFFPGRLIHTNELLVLLGEGYYAERTSKQTIEILKRRGKILESQVESFNAMMLDLKAEASFFDATASEAAEGLVEIREDYSEEDSTEKVSITGPLETDSSGFSEADNTKGPVEDEEYARLLSRLDELEKEELAAESANEHDEDEQTELFQSQDSVDHNLRSSEEHQLWNPLQQSKDEYTTAKEFFGQNHPEQDFSDQLNFGGSTVQLVPKDEVPRGKSLAHDVNKSSSSKAALMLLK
ncbi:hypothetical protein L1049_024187 [Liquidambar formosana]|uniref:RNA polymerase II subunit 5-mediating protein homolog n=1 Tax=Liquidambar formosana TaxID=63359 RepID=A0AAP0S1J3_LIQFO